MELTAGGERKYLCFVLALLSRELFVNDDFLAPRPEVIEQLRTGIREMRQVHHDVRFGNSALGLPGADNRDVTHDALLYEPGCMLHDVQMCSLPLVTPSTAVRQGLHKALLYFWEQVR